MYLYDVPPGAVSASSASAGPSDLPDLPAGYFDGGNDILPEYDVPSSPADPAKAKVKAKRKSRKAMRRHIMPDLPPLPIGELPEDGQSRFDWRDRALSQTGVKAEGERWFPDRVVERVQADKTKLTWGDMYFEELERYKQHFIPLLEEEFQEAQRLYNERLKEWSLARLRREGYTLTGLVAGLAKYQGKDGKMIVEFKQPEDRVLATHHRFKFGESVLISRTDPVIDVCLEDGSLGGLEKDGAVPVRAKVWSTGKSFVRVLIESTETDIEGLYQGTWRLDIGLNEWAHRVQLDALSALNQDPAEQDMSDIQTQEAVAKNKLKRPRYVSKEDWKRYLQQRQRRPEETILAGTSLRDKLLRAFQQDYLPYEPKALSEREKAAEKEGKIANDGIVAPVQQLRAGDVDAVPLPTKPESMSGALIRNQVIKSWTTRYRAEGELVRAEGDPDIPLNPSQLRAIAMMLSERLSLVQGPPGTGKTRVIIETIKLLKQHWQIPHPILVTAHTNVAVDNLLAGLRQHGVKAVRAGLTERVRADLQPYTMDEIAASSHPLHAEVESLQTELDNLWKRDESGNLQMRGTELREYGKELKAKLTEMRSAMHSDILLDADVICTTCLSAASTFVLKHIDFPIVFLDEASMATEPLSLIPLMKGSSHVAIIGDHKQLPPVIISGAAKAGGLATSMFERLIHEKHVPSIMLDTQYRMHPDISAFPSKTFYNSDLKDGTSLPDGTVKPGFDVPQSRYLEDSQGNPASMVFIDHNHPESPQSRSIANHGDAEIISDIVVDLLLSNPDLKGSDIGVIAPYAAQIRTIYDKLNSDPDVAGAMQDVLGFHRALEVPDIEIKTVDGFEGREKAVIIFSTVRSNQRGYIGFLADWRRLNVGITRARRGLIMVGSARTLEQAKVGLETEAELPAGGAIVWRDFMGYLKERGLVISHDQSEGEVAEEGVVAVEGYDDYGSEGAEEGLEADMVGEVFASHGR